MMGLLEGGGGNIEEKEVVEKLVVVMMALREVVGLEGRGRCHRGGSSPAAGLGSGRLSNGSRGSEIKR